MELLDLPGKLVNNALRQAHFPELNAFVVLLEYRLNYEEAWQSGRMYLIRNQAYRKVPWVRIPPLPPRQPAWTLALALSNR